MRSIEWNVVPKRKVLVLLTMEEIVENRPLMMADFQDLRALFSIKYQNWIGISQDRGIRLGKGTPEMSDGIWYVLEDELFPDKNERILPKDLMFKLIEEP